MEPDLEAISRVDFSPRRGNETSATRNARTKRSISLRHASSTALLRGSTLLAGSTAAPVVAAMY